MGIKKDRILRNWIFPSMSNNQNLHNSTTHQNLYLPRNNTGYKLPVRSNKLFQGHNTKIISFARIVVPGDAFWIIPCQRIFPFVAYLIPLSLLPLPRSGILVIFYLKVFYRFLILMERYCNF